MGCFSQKEYTLSSIVIMVSLTDQFRAEQKLKYFIKGIVQMSLKPLTVLGH